MGKRANEIMGLMSLEKSKDSEYPDKTPAVMLTLSKVQKQCAESAAAIAEQIGADEESMTAMCVKNAAMLDPVLNQSYFVRKEVMQWDCRF